MLPILLFLLQSYAGLTAARPPFSHFSTDGTPAPGKDIYLADLQGLTRNSVDRSGKAGDPPAKYFHESTFNAHYDGRFASFSLSRTQQLVHLRALVRSYLRTMQSLGAETWIMHGSLLGWWWNKNILPWDSDIDVQVSESSMEYLATYYNMTVYTFSDAGAVGEGGDSAKEEKKYLLEINPHYKDSSVEDSLNVIDARWIDTSTGLYIDITAIRVNRTAEARRSSRFPLSVTPLYCKDNHHYTSAQIFPLRETTFEGVPAKIPYAYREVLVEEYGEDSLVNTEYEQESHIFDGKKKEWIWVSPSSMRRILQEKHQNNLDAMAEDDEPGDDSGDDDQDRGDRRDETNKHLLAWFIREGGRKLRGRRPRVKPSYTNWMKTQNTYHTRRISQKAGSGTSELSKPL